MPVTVARKRYDDDGMRRLVRCLREDFRASGEADTHGWCFERCQNNKRRACRELGISYDIRGTRGEGNREERHGGNAARPRPRWEPTGARSSRKGPRFGAHTDPERLSGL